MRNKVLIVLSVLLVFSLSSCKKEGIVDIETIGSGVVDEVTGVEMSPEGTAWRDKILNSPKIAEVENKGTTYEVHVSNEVKYIHNTSTSEIITGTTTGDINETVLKDWISPYEQMTLNPSEALFDGTWEYTSARIRGLIGYCDASYNLVTRARTADYIEYIYEDLENETVYRVSVTDDYILFAPLVFTYVFDVDAY